MSVPAGADVTAYADKSSGMVNFRIESFDRATTGAYFLSAKAATSLAAYRASEVPVAQASGSASLNGQAMTLATDPAKSSNVAMVAELNAGAAAAAAGRHTAWPCCNHCSDTTTGHHYNIKTWMGATFNDSTGSSGVHMHNYSGSTSTLGVGVSVTGGIGTFSASGTSTRTSTTSSDYPIFRNVTYRDYFNYVYYDRVKRSCFIGGGWSYQYFEKPGGWAGGATYQTRRSLSMAYCTPVGAKIVKHQDTTRAYEFTTGVGIAGYIGINLSSQTGYSSGTQSAFDMGIHGHPWCGRNGYPEQSATAAPQLLTIHSTNL